MTRESRIVIALTLMGSGLEMAGAFIGPAFGISDRLGYPFFVIAGLLFGVASTRFSLRKIIDRA